MPSAWIERYARKGKRGGTSYRVRYVLGGRMSVPQWAGAFPTLREAEGRRKWITDELAAMRIPNLELVTPASPETLAIVAERWRTSRIDVKGSTATTHSVNLGRILPTLGNRAVAAIAAGDVAALVAKLSEGGLKRESIRKTLATLAMVFDFAGVQPNPARDRRTVKLPREAKVEVNPPTAPHVVAVFRLLPRAYRLPFLVLDATGMRVGELEALTWGDVDELAGKWRVTEDTAKTGQARWVPVADVLLAAVAELVPREDRDLDGQVFAGFGASRLRTAITRACKAAGVPAFSPHDLRHRRATLWHLGGVPIAEASAWLGHSSQVHLSTYAHATLVDRSEVRYRDMLADGRGDHHSVHTLAAN